MSYVIYKIVCDDLPEYVYIGSTINFTHRKYRHKSNCNNEIGTRYNFKIYQIIRENGGWDNWRMVIINECDEGLTKTQAHIIEEEFRVNLKANMNSQKCHVTKEDAIETKSDCGKKYREKNKKEISEKSQEYYQNNKELLIKKQNEYRENNKEYIKDKNKEYREKNKKYFSEKGKEYYNNNKDVILDKMSEKVTCECGSIFRKGALSRHLKSNKHLAFIIPENL
tara:strand:+ start:184 stop:855 length:672 start_codon:yes stop_codon:yes gene_type:complete